jgi:imidazolonepropionase
MYIHIDADWETEKSMTEKERRVAAGKRIWRNARLATMLPTLPGLGVVERGAVASVDGKIAFAGPEADLPASFAVNADMVDCDGRWITPGLIDCHTHLVHAATARTSSSFAGRREL